MDQQNKGELRVQRLAVANPDTLTPTIEMTLADHEFIDEANQIVVASVKIRGNQESMERYQLAALAELQKSLDQVSSELQQKLNGSGGRSRKRSA